MRLAPRLLAAAALCCLPAVPVQAAEVGRVDIVGLDEAIASTTDSESRTLAAIASSSPTMSTRPTCAAWRTVAGRQSAAAASRRGARRIGAAYGCRVNARFILGGPAPRDTREAR